MLHSFSGVIFMIFTQEILHSFIHDLLKNNFWELLHRHLWIVWRVSCILSLIRPFLQPFLYVLYPCFCIFFQIFLPLLKGLSSSQWAVCHTWKYRRGHSQYVLPEQDIILSLQTARRLYLQTSFYRRLTFTGKGIYWPQILLRRAQDLSPHLKGV